MTDDIYVVEKILSRRTLDSGQVEYFLKWFGYDEDDATWEPEENVFCKDLIEQYERQRKSDEIEKNVNDECEQLLVCICDEVQNLIETVPSASPSTDVSENEQPVIDNPRSDSSDAFDRNLITDLLSHHDLLETDEHHSIMTNVEPTVDTSDHALKRSSNTSFARKKKSRSTSLDNPLDANANDILPHSTDMDCDPIDYLSLGPERIISITRSRTSAQELEFLLKCARCPTRLYFISNDKAKELFPELLIDFYERHINWFIDRPTSKQKTQRQKS